MNLKGWSEVKDNPLLKVYVNYQTGDIHVVYPKAPRWAQKVAMLIYKDALEGMPTEKGVKDIVCGLWAATIAEGVKRRKR